MVSIELKNFMILLTCSCDGGLLDNNSLASTGGAHMNLNVSAIAAALIAKQSKSVLTAIVQASPPKIIKKQVRNVGFEITF